MSAWRRSIAAAFAERLPRRNMLVALDLVRAAVALCLPFVTEVWQVYILIFVLQSASAGFTPTFQATIPDVLPEEERYTRALSLSRLGLGETQVAMALGVFGGGSMLAALVLPCLLDRVPDRPVMLGGASAMTLALLALAAAIVAAALSWLALVAAWLLIGLRYSAVLTPSGRLLRRSAQPEDRPGVFAAQFALSHTCWLVTFPLSGWLITAFGPVAALTTLAAIATLGIVLALAALACRRPAGPRAPPRRPAARPSASPWRAHPRPCLHHRR